MIMSIIKDLKKAYPDLMNSTTKFKKIPGHVYVRLPDLESNETSKQRLALLRKIFAFMLTSGLLTDISVNYITTSLTIEGLKNYLETEKNYDEKPFGFYTGKIGYDIKKVRQVFPDDKMIENIARFDPDNSKRPYDMDIYIDNLDEAIFKYSPRTNSLMKTPLNLAAESVNREISDDEFKAYIRVMQMYSKVAFDIMNNSIPDNIKGYIRYLGQTRESAMTEKDRDRLSMLNDIMTGKNVDGIDTFESILTKIKDGQSGQIDISKV